MCFGFFCVDLWKEIWVYVSLATHPHPHPHTHTHTHTHTRARARFNLVAMLYFKVFCCSSRREISTAQNVASWTASYDDAKCSGCLTYPVIGLLLFADPDSCCSFRGQHCTYQTGRCAWLCPTIKKKKGTQIVDVVFFCFFKPRAIKAFQQQQPPSVSSLVGRFVGWLVGW